MSISSTGGKLRKGLTGGRWVAMVGLFAVSEAVLPEKAIRG